MKRLAIDWSIKPNAEDVKPVVIKYQRYLKNIGLRNSTIESHTIRLRNFLEWAEDPCPPIEKACEYREIQIANGLARSSNNNLGFAMKHFYRMNGIDYSFPFMKPNDQIPYYFDEADVLAIFDAANHQIKHLAMLQTLFYGCLRASELCNLDILDLNLQDSTLRWRMFSYYKRKAGVCKLGGLHVFSRHTPATIMIAKGADIRIVQKILRHTDIKTTLRYAHVSDKTQRETYEKFLKL